MKIEDFDISGFVNAIVDMCNGKTITAQRSICCKNNRMIIDGFEYNMKDAVKLDITVNGNCESVNVTCGDVKVQGDVNTNIEVTTGDIRCGNVNGNVKTTTGDIKCGTISGSVRTTTGDIKVS